MSFSILSSWVKEDTAFDTNYVALQASPAKDKISAIYTVLSVLDTKSSALMRLDGVVLAAAFVGVTAKLYEIKSFGFATTAFPCMISMIICLTIVGVDWPFLGNVAKVNGELSFDKELTALRKVRRFREYGYRTAWCFALISAISVLLVLVRVVFL
jgi:hypothetical protein